MIDTEQAPGSRIGVEPHHASLWGQPFDPVVQPSVGIGERSVYIGKGAGMRVADLGQNPVKRNRLARSVRMNEAPLRNRRRGTQQECGEHQDEHTPEHGFF
jgi:hypothetical protein